MNSRRQRRAGDAEVVFGEVTMEAPRPLRGYGRVDGVAYQVVAEAHGIP
jgi:hypothetical protein